MTVFRGKGKALTRKPPQQPVFGAASKATFGLAPQGLCIPSREAPTGARAPWRREQARPDPAPRVRARESGHPSGFFVGEHVEPAAPSRGPQPPSPWFQGGFGCAEKHPSPPAMGASFGDARLLSPVRLSWVASGLQLVPPGAGRDGMQARAGMERAR